MKIHFDMMTYYDHMSDYIEPDKQLDLKEIFDSLEFKLNKNLYHFLNIKDSIEQSAILENNNYYQEIYLKIYYEMESFLVSLRSSVDITLHLLNFLLELRLKTSEVTLYNVYHHKQLPKAVKNIFDRYTRPYNNPTWNFIFSSRNEIVHEKSVIQVLPIRIDFFSDHHTPLVFFTWEEIEREIVTFFQQCIQFLETFTTETFQALKLSLD